MNPVTVNGKFWKEIPVNPTSGKLLDSDGILRIGTTEPATRTIYVAGDVVPPLLDKVILHEMTHAITYEHGYPMEEWPAKFMEQHAVEAVTLASHALGRPLCIQDLCIETFGL